MMRRSIVVGALALVSSDAWSRHSFEFDPPASFTLLAGAVGGVAPARATSPAQASSRIAALADGGALVIDADSGRLVRTDAKGAAIASLELGGDAGTLAYDAAGKRAYVADRRGDRIVAVDIGARLTIAQTWRTPAEPYGAALTPDRATLLVTAIADRALVAYDVATGLERWRERVDPEPRGVAVSADGAHATVASLASGALQTFALDEHHRGERRALPNHGDQARGAFAVAYLGDHLVIAPYERERPATNTMEADPGHYGGSPTPPIDHEVAFLDDAGHAVDAIVNTNEPRAVAWDGARDVLYVVGMAADRIIRVEHASQVDVHPAGELQLTKGCGPDGVAVGPDGAALVWCSFSRTVVRADVTAKHLAGGPELAPTRLSALAHDGLVMFHSATHHVSSFGMLSCGNCHLDGRADGLSWQIQDDHLQTPMLAGRVAGTAPYKWDGAAATLPESINQTVERLGGEGLSKHHVAALAAYLEGMPAPRAPTSSPDAIARGRRVFESAGCESCHDGAKLTDRDRHAFGVSARELDTPSLVGVAASAPYFHDGSAPTLEALLADQGRVHGMAADETTKLSADDREFLVAYLRSL